MIYYNRMLFKNEWPLALVVLIFLTFFFHARLFIPLSLYTSQDYGRGDITHFNYPLKDLYAETLKRFTLPVWTDLISGGYPVLAEGQVGTFYLPNLVLFWLLPTALAFNLSYLVSSILAALGLYLYCRHLKLGLYSSLLAASSFTFSMAFVAHTIHLNVIQTASLIPWILLFGEKLLSKVSLANFLLLAFLINQQLMVGFMQLSLYTTVALILLLIFKAVTQKIDVKRYTLMPLAIVVGVLIGAIQILPTLELLAQAFDPSLGRPSEYVLWIKYPLRHLLYFINPYFFADPSLGNYVINRKEGLFWENNGYMGILPLVLALIALVWVRKRFIKIHLFMLVFWLLFSLGWLFILYGLPPISYFRVTQRSLFFITLSLAVLAGFGLEALLKRLGEGINQQVGTMMGVLLIILSFLNLYLLLPPYNGVLEADKWLKIPATAQFLQDRLTEGRIYSVGWVSNWERVYHDISRGWRSADAAKLLATRASLDPNTNMVFNIASADGYAGRFTKRSHFLKEQTEQGIDEARDEIKISSSSAKLLTIQAVRYLVSSKPISTTSFDQVFSYYDDLSQTSYFIYKNSKYQGRIFAVSNTKLVTTDASFKQVVESENFDPQKIALVETPQVRQFDADVKIEDIETTSSKVSFSSKGSSQALIVVADSFYPGWELTIDGNKQDILPVNINSRGVIVPPGEHQIEMSYQPASLAKGAVISSVTLAAILGFLLKPYITKLVINLRR